MSDTTSNAAPGWYPDVNAPGGQRWWDGTGWTEHVGQPQPYQMHAAEKAPAGTKTGTVWIWLIVLTPLLGLSTLFLVDWKQYVDSTMSSTPTGSLSSFTSPGYLVSQLLTWLLYALTVLFAALDSRELKKRGVSQPFHWAFAFLTNIVYVIGRSVVVRRRTGGGLAPLWVYIAITVITLIASIIFAVLLFNYMFASFATYPVR